MAKVDLEARLIGDLFIVAYNIRFYEAAGHSGSEAVIDAMKAREAYLKDVIGEQFGEAAIDETMKLVAERLEKKGLKI